MVLLDFLFRVCFPILRDECRWRRAYTGYLANYDEERDRSVSREIFWLVAMMRSNSMDGASPRRSSNLSAAEVDSRRGSSSSSVGGVTSVTSCDYRTVSSGVDYIFPGDL